MFVVPVRNINSYECEAWENPALFCFYAMAVLMSMTHAQIADPILQSDVKLWPFKVQTMVKLATEIEESTSDATDYSMVWRRRSDSHDWCASLKRTMFISGLDVPHSPFHCECVHHCPDANACLPGTCGTRPVTAPAPAFQVTKRVPARNTNAIATGRVAACQLPSTMLITRPPAPSSPRRLSCASVILVTAWTAHLTGTKASRRRVESRHVDPWRRLPLPAAAHTDGHFRKQLVPGSTGVQLVVLWDSFLLGDTRDCWTDDAKTGYILHSCIDELEAKVLAATGAGPWTIWLGGQSTLQASLSHTPKCSRMRPCANSSLQRGSVSRTTTRHLNGLGLRRREWAPRQKCRWSDCCWPHGRRVRSSSMDRSCNTVHCRSRSLLQTVAAQRCLFRRPVKHHLHFLLLLSRCVLPGRGEVLVWGMSHRDRLGLW